MSAKRRMGQLILFLAVLFGMTGCGAKMPAQAAAEKPRTPILPQETEADIPETGGTQMKLWINDTEVPVIWEENNTVKELMQQTAQGDITVSMSMYGGNEQVGPLGRSYTRQDIQTTTQNGDIVLYSGNQIVVFYGSNSWAYTRLGKMSLLESEVTDLLANGNVTLRLTAK